MSPDHRELNKDLRVFATDPIIGSGLPLWLPAGAAIRDELQRLAKDIAHADGCVDVYSPVLAKPELFERSGHLAKFADDMFPVMPVGEDGLVLRPANCPHHALIYASIQRSYRELPVRLNELAPMFRAERTGVLSGLSRVRQINLDDTHVFCRPDQVADEVARALRSAIRAQRVLGLDLGYVRLSVRDAGPGWLGGDAQWAEAEEALREAAARVLDGDDERLSLEVGPGEAAFYGPKLDLQVRDGRGHEESIATVQLDFTLPERFGLSYVDADGSQQRVVMIHRGTVGSMERVVAVLLEHHQGRLPFWLAPVQLTVLPLSPDQDDAARDLADRARTVGLRVRVDPEGTLGSRIRASRLRRDALFSIIGPDEQAAGAVQVSDVATGLRRQVGVGALVELLRHAHSSRASSPFADGAPSQDAPRPGGT